jgi:ABC-type Fe3+/spermidine/putrescine transport system ATPase subunit
MIFDMSEEGNFEYLAALALLLQVLTLPLLWIGQKALGRDFMLRRTTRHEQARPARHHQELRRLRRGQGLLRSSCRPANSSPLLGPSGAGETTTLRMLAGFMPPTSGTIELDGQQISSPSGVVPPERRRMSMIFQSYAIWPNMTVGENVGFGLQVRKLSRAEIDRRVDAILDVVQMRGLKERYPAELSGGQQQRVALARAIVVEPEVLLLDEPLSNLDANLREEMSFAIRRLHDEFKITTVYVTHDQSEAMVTSDRIVVMNQGRIEQIDAPHVLYGRPRSRFVAGFIGRTNFLEGTRQGSDVRFDGFSAAASVLEGANSMGGLLYSLRPQAIGLPRISRTAGC